MNRKHSKQQGLALVEALIASAILGIGLVGATQLSLKTLNTASQNRQHTVAQQLAHEAMDCLRTAASWPDPSSAAPCPGEGTLQIHGVPYARQARSTLGGEGNLIDLRVRVSWPQPGQGDQELIDWHSSVSALPSWVGVSLP